MYELSKSISEDIWNSLKLKCEYSEKLKSDYESSGEEYESLGRIKLMETSITDTKIIMPIVKKFPNLHPIKIKDVSNEEHNRGLDFIIEDASLKKYTFAFQDKVLRDDKYPEIAHISGKEKPEYQVEKVFRTQREMRKWVGEDKYSAYYIFYNYLDCESKIFELVKDDKNNYFTPSHGVTAAPVERIHSYLNNISEYNKENPKNIPSKYKKVDKISPLTYPWEYIFEEYNIFNRKEYIVSEKGLGLVMCKTIPLTFNSISVPQVMSAEEYIIYFYGEDKKHLLSEINIPRYVIFGKVNFTI